MHLPSLSFSHWQRSEFGEAASVVSAVGIQPVAQACALLNARPDRQAECRNWTSSVAAAHCMVLVTAAVQS